MATVYPQTESAFADIYGVGRVKLKKYASEFLPLILDHYAAQDIPPLPEAQFEQDD
jgi:superfamily II DNA helicase RecQ